MYSNRARATDFLSQTKAKLRAFLLARGVVCAPGSSGSDTHAQLAEKCFWAEKLDLPVKPTSREAEEGITITRAKKLCLDGGCVNLPWPQTLTSGWEDSPTSLPNVSRAGVGTYIKTVGRKLGLITTEGKATLGLGKGLYLSGHVHDVQYHGISPNINYCFVRARVTPQTKTSTNPYRPWVVLHKSNHQVITAECTCIVGVQSGCKHITALLFAVVEAVERGDNQSCTSKSANWGVPPKSFKNNGNPTVVEEIYVLKVKSNAEKQVLHNSNKYYRSKFDPRANANRHTPSLDDFDLDRLSQISNGNAGILKYYKPPSDPTHRNPDIINFSNSEDVTTSSPVQTIYSAFSHGGKSALNSNDQLEGNLTITYHQQQQLIRGTLGQSDSELWHSHRIGRITSSNVKLCANSVTGNPPSHLGSNSHTAVASVMGYHGSPRSPSLLWGQRMENVSRKHYLAYHKRTYQHKGVSCQQTGLWVSLHTPFIAAPPDGILSCPQCGMGLLEIKNPYKYRDLTINEFKFKADTCLIHCDGLTHLDRSHDYYYQIQFQLWTTGFHWCDFALRTNSQVDNIFVERVVLDKNFISHILPKLFFFFHNGIISELEERSVQNKVVLELMSDMLETIENQTSQTRGDPYSCSVCGLECSYTPPLETMQSIACDRCDKWSHYACVGLSGAEKFLKRRKSLWKCSVCKLSKKGKFVKEP